MTYAAAEELGHDGHRRQFQQAEIKPMTSWKEFWDTAMAEATGRTMVHDYQLTTIGNALKYYGYSFNSLKPDELAKAEELLLKVKPHLFAVSSDYQSGHARGRRLDDDVLDQ